MRNAVSSTTSEDVGKLILRVALAVLILFHGVGKLVGGVGFIAGMLEKNGLPGALAYLVLVGEVLAPILILIGAWTRLAAFIVAGNMVVAVGLVHLGDLFKLNQTGGWELELQGMFLAAAIALIFLGAGRYSLGGANGRLN
ncbi:DoxX family protein [Noviherbaspirillum denitrificans]|uniref:GntR family transcriptional regulator n=1 Tax=Noviherbaspirillum denitrificans TaxID=1968433 RepID=A0A254T916_9BURK|nr:DoxX family protein [Noviherbaspirillum denitrificans]OWW19151.1 GntR family transcriptional regulator [Noviherbaspirillum denitrificans]